METLDGHWGLKGDKETGGGIEWEWILVVWVPNDRRDHIFDIAVQQKWGQKKQEKNSQ